MIWAFFLFFSTATHAIDLDRFIVELQTTGVELEVHGIDPEADRLVAAYRDSQDFFDFQIFALTSRNKATIEFIRTLNRHDRIRVRGEIPSRTRPFLHIEVSDIELLKSGGTGVGSYPHPIRIPDDIQHLSEMVVKVHAVHDQGRMIVADYRGSILPVLVPPPNRDKAAALDRGDLVQIKFALRDEPEWPVHLNLKAEADALEVLEHMSDLHDQPVEYEGDLVLFPASPQVKFNVFALQKDIGHGVVREYTIINFSDPELFEALRTKMQSAWDRSPIQAENDRNKLIKRGLRIKARGRFNFVDKSQANPQIEVESLDDLEVY